MPRFAEPDLVYRTGSRPAIARSQMVALLPRGETWRNFVYTGVLDQVQRDADLSVLSICPNQELWASLQSRFSDVRELLAIAERWPVRIQRELLDVAHGRWLWSEASQERWRLRDADATSAFLKFKRMAKKCVGRAFAHQAGLRILERTQDLTSRLLRTSDAYVDYYRAERPRLVFNASHVHSRVAIPAVEAARWLGIPTATFLFSWDNLTSQGRIIPAYDYYLVWNQAIRGQLLSIYPSVRPERVFITGTPQFDGHFQSENWWPRDEFCRRTGTDPKRPLVLYTTGMPNHMPHEPELVAQIADTLAQFGDEGPQLLVRVYPKDRTGRFDHLRQERSDVHFCDAPWEPNWLTPLPEDTGCLVNALRHADLGINVASTVSLELIMFDKPVLNIGYNPPSLPRGELDYARYYRFDHYRPIVESGAVEVVWAPDELQAAIRRALSNPGAAAPQRQRLLSSFFGDTLDGKSGERVARVLIDLCSDSNRQ